MVAVSLFSIFFSGCSPAVLKYPGTTNHLGRKPQTYLSRFDKRISEERDALQTQLTEQVVDEQESVAQDITVAAASFIGQNRLVVGGQQYRYDCSGLVEATYAASGVPLKGISTSLYDFAKSQRVVHKKNNPFPGDLAFFRNTYDKNKNGKRDDGITHVAIVEKVEKDGTIHLIHLGSKGVTRIFMNLQDSGQYKLVDGKIWNSYLRVATKKDKGPVLTGELWVGFASLWQIQKGS